MTFNFTHPICPSAMSSAPTLLFQTFHHLPFLLQIISCVLLPSSFCGCSPCSVLFPFSHLFFSGNTAKMEEEQMGKDKSFREGRIQSLGFVQLPVPFIPVYVLTVELFVVLNLSVGVFAFVCCSLARLLNVT